MEKERLIRAAAAYVDQGWSVFTVSGGKRPWQNCDDCQPGAHDGMACTHVRCHGHLAATQDVDRVVKNIMMAGECLLAVAGGAVSGDLVVLDAEGHDAVEHGRTGVEVLDVIGDYVEGACLPETLRARSASGGVHLYYRLSGVGAHNRVLPSVDVKGGGGYVVAPPQSGGARTWHNWGTPVAVLPEEAPLAVWLRGLGKRSGSGSGSGGSGARLRDMTVEGVVPAGKRYEFTRGLVYKLRKQGVSWDDAVGIAQKWWERYEQPPAGVRVAGGVWYLPWRQVEYELERAWARVEPGAQLTFQQMAWATRQGTGTGNG
jgi:hypothetical protein